ncbi:MAG TPA: PilZ domain-containing protein [Candidatus Xenobia bacterium]
MSWFDTLLAALGLNGAGALNEDRQRMRIHCDLPAVIGWAGGPTIQGRTLNVNSRGVTVLTPVALRKEQALEVVLHGKRGGQLRLPARAIWCRRKSDSEDHEAGVEFEDISGPARPDVMTFLRQELAIPVLDDRQKRKFRRISANWPVEYAVSTLEHRQAQVKDVSPCGCLLLSRYPLLMYSDVTLSLRPDPASPPIRAHGIVHRCTRLEDEWWEIACPLVSMSEADQARLVNAIEKHMVVKGRRARGRRAK